MGTITEANLKKYHSATNSDAAANGGAVDTAAAITTGVLGNIIPIITESERVSGVTKYRKIFLRNENADSYTSVKAWISANTPSTDTAITISGAGSFSQQGNTVAITGITFTFAASADVIASADCHLALSVGERIFNSTDDTAAAARVISAISADGLNITLTVAYGGTTGAGKAASVCAATGNTFVAPTSSAHADVLNLGNLTQNQSIGVWVKYVVDADSDGYASDTFSIDFIDS